MWSLLRKTTPARPSRPGRKFYTELFRQGDRAKWSRLGQGWSERRKLWSLRLYADYVGVADPTLAGPEAEDWQDHRAETSHPPQLRVFGGGLDHSRLIGM